MSRSIRLTSTHDPKISARSFEPVAERHRPVRDVGEALVVVEVDAIRAHRPPLGGSTSPVGTYHSPVSPMNVVVAGRVCTSSDDVPDGRRARRLRSRCVCAPADDSGLQQLLATARSTTSGYCYAIPHTHMPPCYGPRRDERTRRPGLRLRQAARPSARRPPRPSASTSRPRPPRLICPPLRPAFRASSDVHSCAVPFWCAARPPLLAISRCFSGDIEAKPRRSLRSAFIIMRSFSSEVDAVHSRSARHDVPRHRVATPGLPADPGRAQAAVRPAASPGRPSGRSAGFSAVVVGCAPVHHASVRFHHLGARSPSRQSLPPGYSIKPCAMAQARSASRN